MALSDISVKKPVFAWMLMIGLLVFGTISYLFMGISQLPDVDFPVVSITVTWPGAAPDVMEGAVADIIENVVMSVDGIETVQSTSQQGQTQITLQFSLGQDINVALQQVQTKISQAQRNLPQTIDPPIITKTNPNDQPIMFVGAYQDGLPLRDLSLFVRDHLKDMITTIPGVGDVSLGGYIDPQMRIWLDRKKMEKNWMTSDDVIAAINSEHQLVPTGYQDTAKTETYVRVHSEFTNAKECNDIVIPARMSMPVWKTVRIRDIAQCEEGTDEIRRVARYMGISPTIGLGIIKQRGTNAVAIGDAVRKKITRIAEVLPKGMKMGVVMDTTKFIRDSIHELGFTLIMAVLLTALVCYLFLGSISSAFNVIMAIPVSLVGTFIVLHFLNFTVNTFTLMALSLVIGIVVDDAIMVLENITRHNEMGKERVLAAIVGAREITNAAIASSLAILAIFVPVVFMQGMIGKFFYQFGVAISVAVLISLLDALTLAPMLCSQMLRVGADNFLTRAVSRMMDSLAVRYRHALAWCLKSTVTRVTVLLIAFALFGGSLQLVRSLRNEFLPPQDQSRFMAYLYTPMGSSLGLTDSAFKEAEAFYRSRPEVDTYFVSVGGFGGGLVNQGVNIITLKDPKERPIVAPFTKKPSQQEFMQFARKELQKIKGLQRVALLDLSLTGFSAQRGYPIEFVLQGPNWEKLVSLSSDMRKRLMASGLMADVDSDYNPNMPETEIIPDRVKAFEHGVSISEIAHTISAMVAGMKLLPNKYTDDTGHRDDIQMKLKPEENLGPIDINNIWVRNVQGEMVQLKDLVDIKSGSTLLTVTRYARERGISIYGNFATGKSQSDVIDFIKKLGAELPFGYHVTISGSSQAFQDSMKSLIGALILGIFVAYIVLASQFNSFIHPAIILLALPFSLTGALAAMRLTDTSINIYSLIGILLLMGIVKKNAILLVEFTNHKREEGLDVKASLLEACPIRLRPILMTSIATITAAIPEALSFGSGGEVIRPMAIAVIGGVMVSTFLTLFVVPVAYALAARLESKKHNTALQQALNILGETKTKRTIPIVPPLSSEED